MTNIMFDDEDELTLENFSEASDKDVHKNHRERVREKFLKSGFDSFLEHEVLELILFYSIPRQDTNPIAHRLMKKFGSLYKVLKATPEELAEANLKPQSIVLLTMLPRLAQYYNKLELIENKIPLNSAQRLGEYIAPLFIDEHKEYFFLIFLDVQYCLISHKMAAEGSLDAVPVSPREIAKLSLANDAAYVVLAHNHPSGSLKVSESDIAITGRIQKTLAALDIKLIDHILVAGGRYISFQAKGLMQNLRT